MLQQAHLILEAKKSNKIGKVFAAKNGILGALREDLIDTSKESKILFYHLDIGQVVSLVLADLN
jgi:hypothetical protein